MISLSKITQYFFILLLFSPLLSFFTLSVYNKSITFFTGILFVGIGLMSFSVSYSNIKIPKYAWWLLLYTLFEFTVHQVWEYKIAYRILTSGILYNKHFHVFFAIVLINNIKFSDNFFRIVIPIIKITVILAALVSILQLINSNILDASSLWYKDEKDVVSLLNGDLYRDRRSSIFGYIDMNELGLSYIPLLSVLIGFLLFYRKRSYVPYLILGGITSILSNTRYVMIGYILITLQIFLYQRIRLIGLFKFLFTTIVLFVVFYQVLTYLGYNINSWFEYRIFVEGSIKDTSRYRAIENFVLFFPKYFVLGSGGMTDAIRSASASVGSSQIHVGYLAGLVYYGIIGSFFLFGFWFLLARKLYKTARLTNYWGSFFAFLVFLWANATLVYFHIFFYGIIFALVFDKYYADKYSLQTNSNFERNK